MKRPLRMLLEKPRPAVLWRRLRLRELDSDWPSRVMDLHSQQEGRAR
jgi:hypothetical protein